MQTRKDNERTIGSPKEGSGRDPHSAELAARQGSTEHNDYLIKGSDDKKHETGSPRNDKDHSDEDVGTAGQ